MEYSPDHSWQQEITTDERKRVITALLNSLAPLKNQYSQERLVHLSREYERMSFTNSQSKMGYLDRIRKKLQALEAMAQQQALQHQGVSLPTAADSHDVFQGQQQPQQPQQQQQQLPSRQMASGGVPQPTDRQWYGDSNTGRGVNMAGSQMASQPYMDHVDATNHSQMNPRTVGQQAMRSAPMDYMANGRGQQMSPSDPSQPQGQPPRRRIPVPEEALKAIIPQGAQTPIPPYLLATIPDLPPGIDTWAGISAATKRGLISPQAQQQFKERYQAYIQDMSLRRQTELAAASETQPPQSLHAQSSAPAPAANMSQPMSAPNRAQAEARYRQQILLHQQEQRKQALLAQHQRMKQDEQQPLQPPASTQPPAQPQPQWSPSRYYAQMVSSDIIQAFNSGMLETEKREVLELYEQVRKDHAKLKQELEANAPHLNEQEKELVRKDLSTSNIAKLLIRTDQMIPVFYLYSNKDRKGTQQLMRFKPLFSEVMQALRDGRYLLTPAMLNGLKRELRTYFQFVGECNRNAQARGAEGPQQAQQQPQQPLRTAPAQRQPPQQQQQQQPVRATQPYGVSQYGQGPNSGASQPQLGQVAPGFGGSESFWPKEGQAPRPASSLGDSNRGFADPGTYGPAARLPQGDDDNFAASLQFGQSDLMMPGTGSMATADTSRLQQQQPMPPQTQQGRRRPVTQGSMMSPYGAADPRGGLMPNQAAAHVISRPGQPQSEPQLQESAWGADTAIYGVGNPDASLAQASRPQAQAAYRAQAAQSPEYGQQFGPQAVQHSLMGQQQQQHMASASTYMQLSSQPQPQPQAQMLQSGRAQPAPAAPQLVGAQQPLPQLPPPQLQQQAQLRQQPKATAPKQQPSQPYEVESVPVEKARIENLGRLRQLAEGDATKYFLASLGAVLKISPDAVASAQVALDHTAQPSTHPAPTDVAKTESATSMIPRPKRTRLTWSGVVPAAELRAAFREIDIVKGQPGISSLATPIEDGPADNTSMLSSVTDWPKAQAIAGPA